MLKPAEPKTAGPKHADWPVRLCVLALVALVQCFFAMGARADAPTGPGSPAAPPPSPPSAAPSAAPPPQPAGSPANHNTPVSSSAGPPGAVGSAPAAPHGDLAPRKPTDLFKPLAVEWNPHWARFRTYEYVLVGLQAAAAVAATAIPGGPRWVGHNGFDDAGNKALAAKTISGQHLARDVSDAGLVLMINQRIVDDVFVAWWYHGKGSVGLQLALMDAEALSFSLAVQGIFAGAVGRQRPYAQEQCNRPLEAQTTNCNGPNRYRSFFSGHATAAFTMAGLTCMHHAYLPLYGNKFADAAACVGTLAAATTVSMMRVVGDQHYLSDIIAGAALGTLSGLGIPWVMHYRGGGSPDQPAPGKPTTVTATILPGPSGVSVVGSF